MRDEDRHTGERLICPLFREYYMGVCCGRDLPYTPTSVEKKQYCFSVDFKACSAYEKYLYKSSQDKFSD